jgi:single-strand DNA-binding protein
MSGYNNATILGRLCAPAEELKTKAGKLFIKATITVSVHRKNSEGVSEEYTSFVPATMFGKTAELFLKYVQKGDMVHLAGRLESNEWKAENGGKRLSLSFVVEQLCFLPNPDRNHAPAKESAPKPAPKLNEHGEPEDIPF